MIRTWLDELSIPRPPYRRPMMARITLASASPGEAPATDEDLERMRGELEARAAAEAVAERLEEQAAERPAELTPEQASKDMELGLAGMIEAMETAEREKPLAPEAMADAKAAMTARVEDGKAELQGPPTRLEADLRARGKGSDTIAGMKAQMGAGSQEAAAAAKPPVPQGDFHEEFEQPQAPEQSETPTGKMRRLSQEASVAKNRWRDAEEAGSSDAARLKQEYAAKQAELENARPFLRERAARERVLERQAQERATGEGMPERAPEKAAEDPRDARIRELERKVSELMAKKPEAVAESPAATTEEKLEELRKADPEGAKLVEGIGTAKREGVNRYEKLKEDQARAAAEAESDTSLGLNRKAEWYDARGAWHGFFTWWHSVWEKKAKDGLVVMQERLAKLEDDAKKYREKSWLHTAVAPIRYGLDIALYRGQVEGLKETIKRHAGNRNRHTDTRKELMELAAGQLEVHVRAAEHFSERNGKEIETIEKQMEKLAETYRKCLDQLGRAFGNVEAEKKARQKLAAVQQKMERLAMEKAAFGTEQQKARELAARGEEQQGGYLGKVGLTRESARMTGKKPNSKAA